MVACALPLVLALAAPQVVKVEPPEWWPGHTINPVRLLIRGANLAGARLRPTPGTSVSNVGVNAAGTYLFADLRIDANAAPGDYPLRVGDAVAPFRLSAPLPAAGRFQGLSPDDVIYLIMPDRFAGSRLSDRTGPRGYHGGDLRGIIDRLPYLKDLGVTALWLTPVYDNAGDYHGYGAVDFYGAEEQFGSLATFRELVDAAHRSGIKIVLDQVANHTGPLHPWVKDAPTPTWFHGTAAEHPANNWQIWTVTNPRAGPELRRGTLDGWFAGTLPDLNQDDPEVARYLIQNSLWWIGQTGVDAIRQDTLPYVPVPYWREWMGVVRRQYPTLKVIGEAWDSDAAVVSFFQNEARVDALFDFPLFNAVRDVFARGKPIRALPASLAHDRLYRDPDALVTFLGLHDTARFLHETGADAAGLKLAWTFLLTTRGIPMIYYGDEIGMRGGDDPDNRRDFPPAAFERAGRTPGQQEIFEHVRRLAHLRAATPALRRGRLIDLAADEHLYLYARGKAIVAINKGSNPALVDCAIPGMPDGLLKDRLAGVEGRIASGRLKTELAPRTAAVFTAP